MEAAEPDAAIRAGKRDGLRAFRLHRFRSATFKTEDDRRLNRLVGAPAAALRRNLLGTRHGVTSLALAGRPTAATGRRGAAVRSPTACVQCGGVLAWREGLPAERAATAGSFSDTPMGIDGAG